MGCWQILSMLFENEAKSIWPRMNADNRGLAGVKLEEFSRSTST